MFQVGTDDIVYRPWVVRIPASQGRVTLTLKPHRTLEAKHHFTGGRFVVPGRFTYVNLVTESSFVCFSQIWRGKSGNGQKDKTTWSWCGVRILVGYLCRKAKCGLRNGPLQLFRTVF